MDFHWIELIKYAGLAGAIIIFFIYRDWKREETLTTRITALEDYQKLTLETLIKESTAALTQCSEFIKWTGRVLEHLVRDCPKLRNQGDCEKPENV